MSQSTWSTNPESGEWNNSDNWNSDNIPSDIATFGSSTITNITFSGSDPATINQITFDSDAPAYTFNFTAPSQLELTISGPGVSSNTQCQQSFIVASTSNSNKDTQLKFTNSACAGESNIFYCAGPADESGDGGGVISFYNASSAGSAIFKAWTGIAAPPSQNSTVGGEISFFDTATADTATFFIYGSLGEDGDTFGNVVFHTKSTASSAIFNNVGGTVNDGDGGNTQFYDHACAENGIFNNLGATISQANGGDVAFDGNSKSGHAFFYNYAAPVEGGNGGVTSFNNNYPDVVGIGASADHGTFHNYGAKNNELGGGGHLSFSARYGNPTADNATIINYGTTENGKSSAGHTIFSITLPTSYYSTAGNCNIRNLAALSENGKPGYTEFSIYTKDGYDENSQDIENVPTAGNSYIVNEGGNGYGVAGGLTSFYNSTSAGSATLIAYGGINHGDGGKIEFSDQSMGDSATVQLYGNGELDLSYHTGEISIANLALNEGLISTSVGENGSALMVSNQLTMASSSTRFNFYPTNRNLGLEGIEGNTYAILSAPNLSDFSAEAFYADKLSSQDNPELELYANFYIENNVLYVTFRQG